MRFRDAEGRAFNLALTDPQLRHLDHAYCSTVHSAQGRTARAAIAVLEAGGAADRELFHVELSRVSHAFTLLTDDREALVALLEAREGIEEGALEALGVDPVQIPPVDPEVFADLAEDWRALQRRAEETNTLPFFLPGYREVMARAVALSEIEDLPADMRRFVDGMVAEHETHLARDREVKALTRKIQENWQRWPELGWAASAHGCAVDELPRYAAWREEGSALLEEGSRRLAEARSDRRAGDGGAARHLHAMPGALAGLESAARALERARALDDARRLEPERQALRGEAIRLLEERRELEERAREAHPSGFAPPTGLQGYADWTERCEALTARWRAHPDARQSGPGRPEDEAARIAADVDRLEQLRGHDEAWALLYEKRRTMLEREKVGSVIAFYRPGWKELVGEAHALGRRKGLPDEARNLAQWVRDHDSGRRAERTAVHRFLAAAEKHRRFWDSLLRAVEPRARRDPEVSIVDLPGYRPLSKRERTALVTGRRIYRKEDTYGPHLDRIPDARETLDAALERLNRHLLLDRFVSVTDRIGETKHNALNSGIAPVHDEGYGGAIRRAELLADEEGLEEAARRRLRAELEEHAALARDWLEIERLFREAEELEEQYRELEERAEREDVPRSLLSEWPAWRERNLRFEEDARWKRNDDRWERYREARPDMLHRIEEGLGPAREREAIPSLEAGRIADMVGAALARLRDPGARHAFSEPWGAQEPLLAGERIRLRPSKDGPVREAVVLRSGPTGGCDRDETVELEWLAGETGQAPEERVSRMSGLRLAGSGVHRAEWRDERLREAELARQFPAHPSAFPLDSARDLAVGDRLWRIEVARPDTAARPDDRRPRAHLPSIVRIEMEVVGRTAARTEGEDLCTVREMWRSDDALLGQASFTLDELAVFAGWRSFWDSEEERWSEERAQKIELALKRAMLLTENIREGVRQVLKL